MKIFLCCLQPARVALKSGCEGVSAINTIMSVMGIDLNSLRPEPCVEGLVITPFDQRGALSWLTFLCKIQHSCYLLCLFICRYSTPGGYSCKAVHPIALAKVMQIAQMMKAEFNLNDYSLSGIGGVETGGDAAEFILLGANTVQVGI